jgi:hypothetical protein
MFGYFGRVDLFGKVIYNCFKQLYLEYLAGSRMKIRICTQVCI